MDALAESQGPPTEPGEEHTHDLGTTLGVYKLLDVLGEGGMGRVFLAEHSLLGRKVAIKVLRSEYATDPFVVKRFFAEARTVNQISHDNIVEITDFVDGDDGTSFIVMEYLQGQSLGELLQRGPVGIVRAVRIAKQIASALGAVHAVGIVHRDLKPDNVFLIDRPSGPDFVKLLDFGAAKLNPKVVPGSMKTQARTLIGTPQYMSPEQAAAAPLDHRSDIYALGVVLYELVTGGNPFSAADTWSVIRRQITLEPDQPETVVTMVPPCPDLNDLIMRCLNKDVDERPQSMEEVEGVLRSIDHSLTPATVHDKVVPQRRVRTGDANPSTMMLRSAGVGPSRRRPLIFAGAGLLAAAAVAAAITQWPSPPDVVPVHAPGLALQAPSVTPDPTPAAVVAPEVRHVLLRTEPAGAQVRQLGTKTVLGQTPLAVEVRLDALPLSYEFALKGYEPQRTTVRDASGAAAVTQLSKAAPVPRARARARPRRAARRVNKPQSVPAATASPPAAPAVQPKKAKAVPAGRNGVLDPFAE